MSGVIRQKFLTLSLTWIQLNKLILSIKHKSLVTSWLQGIFLFSVNHYSYKVLDLIAHKDSVK